MSQTGKETVGVIILFAIILALGGFIGYTARPDAPECISCSMWALQPTAVVECEPRRCPTGPVQWSDVFKTPKQGGFTVSIPEGSWRIRWQLEHHQ